MNTLILKLIQFIKPIDPCFHYNRGKIKNLISQIPPKSKILNIGSGGCRISPNTISLDIDHSVNVDIIADASFLPFKENTFNFLISTAVLEHVIDVQSAINEIYRCCKNDGLIYIEVPFLQTYHAHPHDYRRFTLPGLELAFANFEKLESGVCVGPFSVLAWYLRKMPRFLAGNGRLGLALELIAGWFTFWIKYFDWLLPPARRVHQAASGVYFYGQKGS